MNDEDKHGKDFSEQREFERKKVKQEVRVEVDGEVIVGEASDISLGGIAVNAHVDMTTEQFVRLHTEKFGELTGKVVREFDDGFAVKFDTVEGNGTVLENKLRAMLGNSGNDDTVDDVADEKARMEAQLMSMFGDDDQGGL